MNVKVAMPPEEEKVQQSKSLLDIDAEQFYKEKMRPYIETILRECKTDQELIRTLRKILNSADSIIFVHKDYENLESVFDVALEVITDSSYFVNGPLRKAPEEEKQKVRKFVELANDLLLIAKNEPLQEKKEEKKRERIGYSSPNGENEDFSTRNSETLYKPTPKKRVPNARY